MVKSHFFQKWSINKFWFSAWRRLIWAGNSTIPWILIFTLVRGDPFDLGGLSATPRGWTGQKQVSKCFLGPYGIPHSYKCHGKNNSKVWFLDTAILFPDCCLYKMLGICGCLNPWSLYPAMCLWWHLPTLCNLHTALCIGRVREVLIGEMLLQFKYCPNGGTGEGAAATSFQKFGHMFFPRQTSTSLNWHFWIMSKFKKQLLKDGFPYSVVSCQWSVVSTLPLPCVGKT